MDERLFTPRELSTYRPLKRGNWSNAAIGQRWRRKPAEVDIALNALMGRTAREAALELNFRLLAAS